MKQLNKTVAESFSQKFREWWCRKFGHITVGPYYGMAQGYCRRCGKKNEGIAYPDAPLYENDIWGPFFK